MLQALDENDRLIRFTDKRSYSEWRYLQKAGRFRCPICNQQVRMRLGTKRRWHFAHQKSEQCPSGGEGESDEHVRGKQLLFHWAAKQNKATQLETYLRESKQR
ncbi:competence protein CoiA, partial [Bacillus subtilis]